MDSTARTLIDAEGLCFPRRGAPLACSLTRAGGIEDTPRLVAAPGPGLPRWLADLFARRLGDRYARPALLGVGGMGAVLRARDTWLERWVAIKVPAPHLASVDGFRFRMLREARALAQVDHPNVVRVHDLREAGQGEPPLLVLEYLEGQDLERRLRRHGRPPLMQSLTWIQQAARGLQHVHERGLVHRDLKPSNLVLAGDRVVLIDFGLAVPDGRRGLTSPGVVAGSPGFVAPERFEGALAGPAADQFALAVTAGRLLLGLSEETSQCGPPALLERLRESPFRAALARALARDPAARFPDVATLATALREVARCLA